MCAQISDSEDFLFPFFLFFFGFFFLILHWNISRNLLRLVPRIKLLLLDILLSSGHTAGLFLSYTPSDMYLFICIVTFLPSSICERNLTPVRQ